jgi:hypothetical protein
MQLNHPAGRAATYDRIMTATVIAAKLGTARWSSGCAIA